MDQVAVLGTFGALIAGTAAAVSLLALWIISNRQNVVTARAMMREAEGSITFLFQDESLIDVTPRARALMEQSDGVRTDWENFLTLLSARFPHLRSQCRNLASEGRRIIKARDNEAGFIDAEYWNGLARITLVQDEDHPDETLDPLTAAAMEHELETLRSIGEDSPQLIWKRDAEGVLVWANRAYIELSDALYQTDQGSIRPWPPREIFHNTAVPAGTAPLIDMHCIDLPEGEKPIWYEITSLRRGTDTICFAVDSSAVVTARDAQRSFVQTLSKTFAQLSVGLAIFDAERQLVLFNPALVDLTGLPASFLISHPTLFSVLDRLRDQQMIPEPKNYQNWRDQMVALETAAVQGSYHETWSLPNGQTFRVTGKPHPNGAVAFLMEDISDEISLTRKIRSQVELSNSVFDNISSAICVFGPSGSLIMTNRAYKELWGADSEGLLTSRGFQDEMNTWQAATAPSPAWIKLQKTVMRPSTGTPWSRPILIGGQVELTCHYAPLPDGNHQVTFTSREAEAAPLDHLETQEFQENKSATG